MADAQGERADAADAPGDGGDVVVDAGPEAGDGKSDAGADANDAPVEVGPCMDWERKEPEVVPRARAGHALTWDGARKRVVLFGGVDATESAYADIWEWDGSAWTDVTPSPLPMDWPHNRQFSAIAYDGARKKLVIYAGDFDAKPYGDWWEWDAETATMAERPAPATWPAARAKHGFVYDEARDRFVIFGGFGDDTMPRDDLWEVDASGADLVAEDRTPDPRPPSWPKARYVNGGMSYAAGDGRTLLFGGQIATVTYTNDLWAWDGAAGTFTDLTPAPLPAAWPKARACHATAWDAKRGRLMLFEGCAPSFLRDLWDWDASGGTFTDRTPAAFPPSWPLPQAFPAIAYDRERGVLVEFGGGAAGGDSGFSDDTFEYKCDM